MTYSIDFGRRSWLLHAGCVAMASPSVWAQPRAMPRIAWLSYTRADSPLRPLDAFRQGMRSSGYEDGVNLRIDARWGDDSRPAISGWAEFARRGNLLSYGPNATHAFTRVAYFVERILKGAKPTELPVEQPTVVELVLNQKAARAMGITIAQSLLLRADEVIQ